jgi:bifunctional enzyme Fae/Hps
MIRKTPHRLSKKKRYLQIAFNGTLSDARAIIARLPASDRILIEAGTPLIKQYGMSAIRALSNSYRARLGGAYVFGDIEGAPKRESGVLAAFKSAAEVSRRQQQLTENPSALPIAPYIVADMKTMDRGRTEVMMAAEAGASAVVALGSAPLETLNTFAAACEEFGVDAMIDMMNVSYPLSVLSELKTKPRVVILHRGVDEERDNKSKMLPLQEIRRIKGAHDMLIAVAGGDTPREVQSAIFNDTDIVVIWKSVYENTSDTINLVTNFFKEVK